VSWEKITVCGVEFQLNYEEKLNATFCKQGTLPENATLLCIASFVVRFIWSAAKSFLTMRFLYYAQQRENTWQIHCLLRVKEKYTTNT
jgi:hypothetical protein